jgi:ubiquitin conjugation factor E4 B
MDPNEQPPSWTGGDAPDKQKMDEIRARRLAKLGGPPAASSSSKPAESKTPAESPEPSSSSTPKPQPAEAEVPRASINITPASSDKPAQAAPKSSTSGPSAAPPGSLRNPRKRSASDNDGVPPAPAHRAEPPKPESDEDYANRVLSSVFRITVNPHQGPSYQGYRPTFLPNLNQELNDAGEPLKLSVSTLDQAIIEACTAQPHDKPLFGYLLPCWKRAVKSATSAKITAGPRFEVHEEAKRLCMSNCLFALSVPDLYGRDPNPAHDTLKPYLLRDLNTEDGLDFDFFREAIKRFDDDESYPAIFDDAMVQIGSELATKSMEDHYKPYVTALLTYTRFPILISNLAKHPTFNMAQSAPGIEKHTLLGPFFRLSPLQPQTIKSYFPTPRATDDRAKRNSQDSLRMVLRAHQDNLFSIANAFIRAGIDTRNRTLDWFAYIMNTNHKRRAMRVDPRTVASEGFMMNITAILDRFCEPFMDTDFSKIDKIDIRYFKKNPRVDIKDETKINADQTAADKFYAEKESGETNFISEVFFLALAAHHYGSEAAHSQLKSLDDEIKYLEKHLKQMEPERMKFLNSPANLKIFDDAVQRHVNVLEKSMGLRHAIEGALLDERMQGLSLRFMRYVAVWLLRVATGSNYKPGSESKEIKLPLPAEQSLAFACLPEYALQNIVDNFKFLFRYLSQLLPNSIGEEMVALAITFLRSSEYIKNPGLKSLLVSLLFWGTWPFMQYKRGVLGDHLVSLSFANDNLLHALMKFYIECEHAGQFTDKLHVRYEIFQIMKCIWANDVYKKQLTRESKNNRNFFVQFVNMLLNDTTFVLDEAFTKFPKIRALEIELKDPSLSVEDRQKKEEEVQSLGNQATSYMQLANETLEMMKLFTAAVSEAFVMPEIVSRLASMLNYNLETLAGKKAAAELNVANRDKYHFRPATLISDFVEIYVNLGTAQVFIDAVAADGRSYKPEVLEKVTKILTSRSTRDPSEIAKWDRLRAKFAATKQLLDQAELDLGEIPGEYEDPIMGDLMRDPVLLPSKQIVDRSTIVQHLLSDPIDPFTRQPMTIDDVVPVTELREEIEKWREGKVQAAKERLKAETGVGGEAEVMDTTEG